MRFDPHERPDIFRSVRPFNDKWWAVTTIIGPYDACNLVTIREKVVPFIEGYTETPTDIFVMSVAEPDDRSRTKIGGLPYLPKDSSWPVSCGKPLPFFAQVNFQQSHDIIGDTPEELLLLFGNPLVDEICFKWVKLDSTRSQNG